MLDLNKTRQIAQEIVKVSKKIYIFFILEQIITEQSDVHESVTLSNYFSLSKICWRIETGKSCMCIYEHNNN